MEDGSIYDTLTPEKREKDAQDALKIRSEHILRSENLPFDIDVWYPMIQQFTFKSIFLPLKRCEARAIINFYNTAILGRKWLQYKDVLVLKDLERRLQILIDHNFPESGAFMRLCGRSPKDADPLHPERVLLDYQRELSKLLSEGSPDDPNTKFIAFVRTNFMKVNSAGEVMNLLLTSERVHIDMDDWLRYGEPEQIVLRQWEPQLLMEYEFRCYVNNSKLNGISQYDHYGVFPHLEQMKDKIQGKLIEKWKEVHPYVGEDSYVIDFGYLHQSDEVVVIEVSPFLTCTGPACFRWSNEKDRSILENGPFEFRLNKVSKVTDGLIVSGIDERFKPGQVKYTDWFAKLEEEERSKSPIMWGINYVLEGLSLPNPFSETPVLTDMFFYGTLKTNFHWNAKFLSHSKFISSATTLENLPLVVGECGVPYLIGNRPGEGKKIKGEVWQVDAETLEGLDEYEGIRKGYYCRRKVQVVLEDGETVKEVEVYMKSKVDPDEFKGQPYLEEYTYEMHKTLYKPIKHIQVKQRAYIGIGYDIKS